MHAYPLFTFCLTTDTGEKTHEYITLLESLSSVTKALSSVPESKDQLCLKFMEKKWLNTTANPSEKDLVLLALNRVKEYSHTFYEFVEILSDIGVVVKNLTAKPQESM